MCGIAGFVDARGGSGMEATVRAMGDAIRLRGPDDAGEWCDSNLGVALGHRRLSILDLSPAGHQPMLSRSGRLVMVFNGEVYNHNELRAQLQAEGAAPEWRGHSDTETMLAAFEAWGVQKSLERFAGMYAFALWDRETRTLTLARDRAGEKPLYFGWQNGVFMFASELKALKAHPAFRRETDPESIARFLRYSYVPAPHSIYRGIGKILPGHWLTLTLDDLYAQRLSQSQAYWSAVDIAAQGDDPLSDVSDEAAIDMLEKLLLQSVSRQMMADVPLGALLSGGIDSSSVVALMQAQSSRPVHTFTIGFEEKQYNEAEHAKRVAAHLGTQHTELYVTPQTALELIPQLPELFDEPMGDNSTIPTFLVSRLARQHVTVALSGDGGDELFHGYARHDEAERWAARLALPAPLKRLAALLLRATAPVLGARVTRFADVLELSDEQALYDNLMSHWRPPHSGVAGVAPVPQLHDLPAALHARLGLRPAMALNDLLHYLPDHVLAKVDRAAMAVSLETRAPLLDPAVMAFALRLPQRFKRREGRGKWLLRQVLYKHVPRELIDRPKMGFAVPIAQWLQGPLRPWAEDLLSEQSLREAGFDVAAVREKWAIHLAGTRNQSQPLWNVLVMQQWLRSA